MPRTPFESLILRKSLDRVALSHNEGLLDHLVASGQAENAVPLKNVCAKVSVQLADEIDQVCEALNISKRLFLEAAFSEACLRARQVMAAEGVDDVLEGRHLDQPDCGCLEVV